MKASTRSQLFAIAYDLSDNKERRGVDKALKGWGHRVQKSVFVVRVRRHEVARLKAELERLQLQSGSVLFFRLQAETEVLAVGQAYVDWDAESAYVV